MGNKPSKREHGHEEPIKTTLFKQESTNGVTYRIPSLIYLKDGHTYLAFAEKRTTPSDSDSDILVMRTGTFTDDGSIQWSASQELSVAHLAGYRTMNPCPVYEEKSGTVFLFFICVLKHVPEHHQIVTGHNEARLCYVTSADRGQIWSPAKDVTGAVIGKALHKWATFAVGPGHGVQLKGGRLIIPAYAYYVPVRCLRFPIPFTVHPYALSIYSDDHGHTWHMGKMLQRPSCECEMAEIIDREGTSHLYCNARNTRAYRVEALSENSGLYFNKPSEASELIEPGHGCQGSVIGFPAPEFPGTLSQRAERLKRKVLSLDTQTWLLFSHPTDKHTRRDLGVYLNRSPLRPSHWEKPVVIHSGPCGYSDLAFNQDRKLFSCLMECGEYSELEEIAFVSFTLSDVIQKFQQLPETSPHSYYKRYLLSYWPY